MPETTPTFTCLPFKTRLDMAASHIASGRDTNRTFDGHFENDDGDVLVVALARRARKKPNGRLAINLERYLFRENIRDALARYASVADKDLPALAERIRATKGAYEPTGPVRSGKVSFVIVETVVQWVEQFRLVTVDVSHCEDAGIEHWRSLAEQKHYDEGSDYIESAPGDLVDFIGVTQTRVACPTELKDLPSDVRRELLEAIVRVAESERGGG